ncbi:MAG: ferrochelatase [Opitutaceae bacterium]|nr:ferrochelatase [Cytophagales bacterium]
MGKAKYGVLLLNLGTPDSPETSDVRKYLREFLMDRRVIDIPAVNRFFLINLIIAPFRAPKSAKVYKELWTEEGSPLKTTSVKVEKLLQESLGTDYQVVLGMRYQNPSIEVALKKMENVGLEKIIIIPLYPQYASASTGSSHEEVMRIIKNWEIIPELRFLSEYSGNEQMVNIFARLGKKHMAERKYDHFLFSYHGLPERQILKGSCNNYCKLSTCCNSFNQYNRFCYRAQCFNTSRILAKALNLTEKDYTVSFQSRLGKTPWIKPYTDNIIKQLVKDGKQNVLCFSPSFVADCLETTIEIGEEYKELFEKEGGKHWQLVESLNTDPEWIECLASMVKN